MFTGKYRWDEDRKNVDVDYIKILPESQKIAL